MDLASFDLQNHQLARQLHLMSHLYEVFLTNAMCYPLFYESLHPSAKQQARHVLLTLNRVFAGNISSGSSGGGSSSNSSGSALFNRSPYRLYTMRCILSYLVYPDCTLAWPLCVSRNILSAAVSANTAASTPLGVAEAQAMPPQQPPQTPQTPSRPAAIPPSLDATPFRLGASTAESGTPQHAPRAGLEEEEEEEVVGNTMIPAAAPAAATAEPASLATPSPQQQPQPPPQQQQAPALRVVSPPVPPPTAAPALTAVTDIQLRPLFYVRPLGATTTTSTSAAAAERSLPYFGTTTQIYVRMIHPHLLNEESLNPYFGRYGQVDCTAIQRTSLQQYATFLGPAATEALHQLFATSHNNSSNATAGGAADAAAATRGSLYVQDFIISVDSHQNAVHAVRRAYYKELVCIALHDGTGVRNTHCLADVNAWMRRYAFVWRLRAEAPLSAAERELAMNAEAAAAAKRRKRSRARHRLLARKRTRRAVLGDDRNMDEDDDDVDAASASATSSDVSDADGERKKGDRSGSESDTDSSMSSSGSSGSSSSSSTSSTEDDLAQFVPDIVLDGFPYWTTEDQLKVLLQNFGTVVEIRLSLDDLSGAFTGCALVRMSTLEEAIRVSRELHDTLYRGYRLISGVINERLEVVALENGEEVRVMVSPEQMPHDVSLNERVWV